MFRAHHQGVALILNKESSKSVIAVKPKSDRTLLVKLKSRPVNINLIVAYAPTAESNDTDIDRFYADLD